MSNKRFICSYLCVLACFAVLDGIWIGILAKNLYFTQMKGIIATDGFNTASWIIFYLMYSALVVVMVVSPAVQLNHTALKTTARGAFLGFGAYGTYNLTNYAIIADWPLFITLVDLIWGTCATAIMSYFGWRCALAVKTT